jgi:hypothetical protein
LQGNIARGWFAKMLTGRAAANPVNCAVTLIRSVILNNISTETMQTRYSVPQQAARLMSVALLEKLVKPTQLQTESMPAGLACLCCPVCRTGCALAHPATRTRLTGTFVVATMPNVQATVVVMQQHKWSMTLHPVRSELNVRRIVAMTLLRMMRCAARKGERARKPIAKAPTRSWQSLQITVMLPHAQTHSVVVRQRNAQVMVVARRAR